MLIFYKMNKLNLTDKTDSKRIPVSDRKYYLFALKIIGDFGIAIAAPIVILVLIGQYLDARYQRQILFTVLAFIFAAVLSALIIYRKAKKYGRQYQSLK